MPDQSGNDDLARVGLIDCIGFPLWHEPYEATIPVELELVRNKAG